MLLAEKLESLAETTQGELPLPAGPGSGALNEPTSSAILEHVKDIANSPSAEITLGSICSKGNLGNAFKFADKETGKLARDFYHDPRTGKTVNSIVLKQPGIEEAEPVIKEARKIADDSGKLLKVSVSTLGIYEDASVVLPELTERVFESGAHGVEVNLGCPNGVEESGLRHPILGLDPIATRLVLDATIGRIGQDKMLGAKLSWYDLEEQDGEVGYFTLLKVLDAVDIPGVDFVTLCNTKPRVVLYMTDGQPALDKMPNNIGGGSGPALKDQAYKQLRVARERLPNSIEVISANGVMDGAEIRRRELAGAILSEMVTRLWHGSEQEGISFGQVMKQVYNEYIEARRAEVQ